ncbi:MATE family efflux transporter [Succinivibrio sp.]|uniref:MATE family efflux transporter n=1 Tax=Succinivibrio sp. TaxID=2053619 RepID=UPI00386D794E
MHSDILTRGNIYRAILLYAIPIIIGNSVQQLYNFCDMLIVGRIIGLDALAACGATGPIFFIPRVLSILNHPRYVSLFILELD